MKLALHNAMWPAIVGKTDGTDDPPVSIDDMIKLTKAASVGGRKFDGADLILIPPHFDPNATDDEIKRLGEKFGNAGLAIGSLVAFVWAGTAMDAGAGRKAFLDSVRRACHVGDIFRKQGLRTYGKIRIDSSAKPEAWSADPRGNSTLIADSFREAGKIAQGNGEVLAAEGEICWAGMHTLVEMLRLLEEVNLPGTVGFQADLAHTYLYLLGYNAPAGEGLLKPDYAPEEFWPAYQQMVDRLRPWTLDFHVAQNDGTVKGSGSHDKTGRHCQADDPNGKLDIVACALKWLEGAEERGIRHICWDGCMFPPAVLHNPQTWNTILGKMIEIADKHAAA